MGTPRKSLIRRLYLGRHNGPQFFKGTLEKGEPLRRSATLEDIMNRILIGSIFIIGLGVAIVLQTKVFAQGIGNCGSGFLHKDESAPFGWTRLDGDMIIKKVIVKAGSQNQGDACFEFDQAPANDGCYEVLGLGTSTVTVIKVGEGRNCKDISHVEFYGDLSPSPSPSLDPSPSATPSASPSPSIDPSPSATPSASPSPSPSVSPSPSPLPSPTPEVKTPEQEHAVIMKELKEEHGTVPELGYK